MAARAEQSGPLMSRLLELNYMHHVPASPKPAEFKLVWEQPCVNAIGEWRSSYRYEALCLKKTT
jgi:hypothetical protein